MAWWTSFRSGVGQIVKDLRKHAEVEIQAKAKTTFAKWKTLFKPAEDGKCGVRPRLGLGVGLGWG